MTIKLLDFPGLRKRLTLEPLFAQKLVEMCDRLGFDPNNLLSVMSVETAGTMDPAIENTVAPFKKKDGSIDGYATGLIQFIPSTARALGTTTETLKHMSAVEQLQYVERFFKLNGTAGNIRRNVPGDYYMAVFMPAFVGAPADKVLGRVGDGSAVSKGLTYDAVYQSNKGFDRGHHGYFTVQDVWDTTLGRIDSAKLKSPLEVPDTGPLAPASPPARPSLPPAWRSSLGPSDLPVLRIGARGTAVALAQRLSGSDLVTGVFTEAFALDFVKPLQAAYGIDADGVIGPLTWELLALRDR
jgi:hypothetical protein